MSVGDPRPLQRLLVANRGEIACRIIRSARRLGLQTVALHSTVDAGAPHVRLADESVELPGTTALETYLAIPAVVAAARRAGADAVHPGYGFLSENPAFVDACEQADLIFVGPPAQAMRAMGLKDAAKALMEQAGVPVVPGYHGDSQETDELVAAADRVGYPVLIKARAGGGGKGMRRVDRPADFAQALTSVRREAAAAFADDRVLIEKCIAGPRHVEVQVFADTHGNVVHLFERDCSLQRRHQKVIEEAPAPGMSAEVRSAMTDAAVRAATAIGYVGAGTIEFIADGRDGLRADGFWFMEMNTRLQVEHPVTEMVTGVDLVEWQLRVAAGERLPLLQSDIALRGHAVEARLYAEDAAAGFLPATGTLHRLAFGTGAAVGVDGAGVDGLRVDSGVLEGDEVSPYYDPMLAKLLACGDDRRTAFTRLASLLRDTTVLGTVTNRDFLLALCRHPEVLAARLDTDLIGRELTALTTGGTVDASQLAQEARTARAVAAVLRTGVYRPDGLRADTRPVYRSDEAARQGPASTGQPLAASLGLWSLWGRPARRLDFRSESNEAEPDDAADLLVVREGQAQWAVTDPDGRLDLVLDIADTGDTAATELRVQADGRWYPVNVLLLPGQGEVQLGERTYRFSWQIAGAGADAAASGDVIVAAMPGRVIDLDCAAGDTVQAGQSLVTLEAMKMEHALLAPRDGTVEAVCVAVGDQVQQGAELIRLDTDSS